MAENGGRKVVARNRKARHEYEILETYEAGMVLRGAEVKSLREGKASFQDAYARIHGGELWLHSLHISPYEQSTHERIDPLRTRKLLLKKHEIQGLVGSVEEKGRTLIPLEIYFRNGYAKILLALARGKKLHDKREDLKRKVQQREAERAMGRHR
jgi:SsrA-binding protein